MSDASKAYTFLCENVPKWKQSVEDLQTRTSGRQDEITKVAVPVNQTVKKTGSTETIRDEHPNHARHADAIAIEITSAPAAEDAGRAASARQHQSLLAKRKRKTASLLSGHMSGPSKYRSRGLVVVYYDSEVQKAFEMLVRNIGAGRNLLRKGKMAARIDSLGDLGESGDEDDGAFDHNPVLAKIGYQPRLGLPAYRTARARVGFGELADGTAAPPDQFDTTDKVLEKAQSLCERGAHQFLRDGDCSVELDGCLEQFTEALRLAEPEAVRHKAKDEQTKKKQEERERRQREREQQQQQSQTQRPQQQDQQQTKREQHARSTTATLQMLRHEPFKPVPDSTGILEVDDASDNDVEEEPTLESLAQIRMRSRMIARV